MPTPVGHAIGGLAAALFISSAARRPEFLSPRLLFAATAAAVLPDRDLIVGSHRTYTHSVGAVAMVGFASWALLRSRIEACAGRRGGACLAPGARLAGEGHLTPARPARAVAVLLQTLSVRLRRLRRGVPPLLAGGRVHLRQSGRADLGTTRADARVAAGVGYLEWTDDGRSTTFPPPSPRRFPHPGTTTPLRASHRAAAWHTAGSSAHGLRWRRWDGRARSRRR